MLSRRTAARVGVRAASSFREIVRPLGGPETDVTLDYCSDEKHLAILTLRNPDRKNSVNGKMMVRLSDCVDELEKWTGSCLIVRGDDRAKSFCSGADLTTARAHLTTPQSGLDMCHFMQQTLTRLHKLPLISVAAIEGAAIGGGSELATACDFRVIARDARIQSIHVKMGVSPGWGGGARLTRLVGRQRALRMLGASIPVPAEEALVWGLVDSVCEPGQTLAAAKAFLKPFLAGGVGAVRGAKRVVDAGDNFPVEEAHKHEASVFYGLWGGPANQAALVKK